MKRWTMPDNYMGPEWPEHYVFIGQHRDSDALVRSNFAVAQERLEKIPEPEGWPHDDPPWQVVRASHWLVGWVEWIAVHEDAAAHIEEAERMEAELEDYPVLDEEDYSQREDEEALIIWRDCYDWRERAQYIRKHEYQFEFHDWRDMLGCVRGNYFAGYATELIN